MKIVHVDGETPPSAVEVSHVSLRAQLTKTFNPRLTLVSPPRTGSTLLARVLWSHPDITHHSHEPFEAEYWGGDLEGSSRVLGRPMDVRSGERVPIDSISRGGLLVKEMTFQVDFDQFLFLARLATLPVIFVIRDPRLAATSRLRIIKELRGAESFPAFEGGWMSLSEQVKACREASIPFTIVDSDTVRADPLRVAALLEVRLGLAVRPEMLSSAGPAGHSVVRPRRRSPDGRGTRPGGPVLPSGAGEHRH